MIFLEKNILFGIVDIGSRLPQLFAVGYLAKILGPEIFSTLIMLMVIQSLISGVMGLGMSTALSRFAPSATESEAEGLFAFSVLVTVPIFLFILLVTIIYNSQLAQLLDVQYHYSQLLVPVVIIGFATILEGTLDAFFKSRGIIRSQFIFLNGRTIIEIFIICFLMFGLTPEKQVELALSYYVWLTAIFRLFFYLYLVYKNSSLISAPALRRMKEMIAIGGGMLLTFILSWLVTQSDRLIVSTNLSSSDLGIYGFGAVLAGYSAYLSYLVFPLLQARAILWYESGKLNNLRRLIFEAQMIYSLLLIPYVLFLMLFSNELIYFFAGESYLDSGKVLIALTLAICIDHSSISYEWIYLIFKKTKYIVSVTFAHALFRIIGFSVLIGTVTLHEAIWIAPIISVIVSVLRLVLANRLMKFPIPWFLLFTYSATLWLLLMFAYFQNITVLEKVLIWVVVSGPLASIFYYKVFHNRWIAFPSILENLH